MSNVTKTQGLMRAMRLVESANELPEFIKSSGKTTTVLYAILITGNGI